MFLVFGEKQYTKKMGFVAEHCPTCEAITPFKINRVGRTAHIFWLPLSKGHLIGYYGVCQQCAGEFDIEPTDYVSLSRKHLDKLSDLQIATNPKLDPRNRDALTSFERFRSIRDPLLRFNRSLQQRYAGGTRLDWTSGLAFLATFAIPVVMFTVDLTFLSSATQETIRTLSIWAFLFGLISSFVLLAWEPRRFFRRKLESKIVEELSKVNPQADELDECLKRIKKYEYKVREHVSTTRLLDQIQSRQLSFS